MKVYVEKMPKECYCCVFNIEDTGGIGGYCIFGGGKKTCPLIPLSDHDKKVKKEVCEEITELAKNHFEFLVCDECYNTIDKDVYISSVALTEILEQIQSKDS